MIRAFLFHCVSGCAAFLLNSPNAVAGPASCDSAHEIVQAVVARAPLLQVERARLEAAEATAKSLQSGRHPQISLFARTGVGDGSLQSAQTDNEIGLQMRYRLYDFGKSRNEFAAASAVAESIKFESQSSEVSAKQRALRAINELTRISEIATIVDRRIEALESRVELTDLEIEIGATTTLKVSRLRSELALAKLNRVDLMGQFEVATSQLAQLTGEEVQACLESDHLLAYLRPSVPDSLDALIAGASATGAMKSARRRLAAARTRSELTGKGRLPSIELSGFLSQSYNDVLNEYEQRERVGIQMSMPLIDGGTLRQQAARGRAEIKAAGAELKSIKLEQEVELATAWHRHLALSASMVFLQDALGSASDYSLATEQAFNLGASTIDELLEAEQRADDLRILYANSAREQRAIIIELLAFTPN